MPALRGRIAEPPPTRRARHRLVPGVPAVSRRARKKRAATAEAEARVVEMQATVKRELKERPGVYHMVSPEGERGVMLARCIHSRVRRLVFRFDMRRTGKRSSMMCAEPGG